VYVFRPYGLSSWNKGTGSPPPLPFPKLFFRLGIPVHRWDQFFFFLSGDVLFESLPRFSGGEARPGWVLSSLPFGSPSEPRCSYVVA